MATDTTDSEGLTDKYPSYDLQMGEDGEPTHVRDEGDGVTATFSREDGTPPGESTITYHRSGNSVEVSAGDTILGPDGEERVTVRGYTVTLEPFLSVDLYVDLPREDGGHVPYPPEQVARRWLGYEDNDGIHYQLDGCVAASGKELERLKYTDELETLRSLEKGDQLTWGDRSQPLTVTSTQLTFSESAIVEGPRGGEYTIDWRDGTAPTVRRGAGFGGRSLGRPDGLTVLGRSDGGGDE